MCTGSLKRSFTRSFVHCRTRGILTQWKSLSKYLCSGFFIYFFPYYETWYLFTCLLLFYFFYTNQPLDAGLCFSWRVIFLCCPFSMRVRYLPFIRGILSWPSLSEIRTWFVFSLARPWLSIPPYKVEKKIVRIDLFPCINPLFNDDALIRKRSQALLTIGEGILRSLAEYPYSNVELWYCPCC